MALDPGSWILDRGPRAPFWAMGYPKGPWPRSFLDGPGAFKALVAFGRPCSDGLAWGPVTPGARPLNGPWVKTQNVHLACVYLSLSERALTARLSKEPDGLPKRQRKRGNYRL